MAKAKFERPNSEPVTTPKGLVIKEEDMPKSFQGIHSLLPEDMAKSTPRRVYAFDPKSTEKRRVAGRDLYPSYHKDEEGYDDYDRPKRENGQIQGNFVEGEGKKGLVGYTDIYREPETATVDREKGVVHFTPGASHVGYAQVPDNLRGGGIGAQMLDYVHNTSGKQPEDGFKTNLGAIASKNVMNWGNKKNDEDSGSVIGYRHRWMGQ